MKKLMTPMAFLALLFITTACDSPRSKRAIMSSSKNALTAAPDLTKNEISDTDTDTDTTTSVDANVPADAKHCKFSTDGVNGFESSSAHLGSYTLCQSSTDKTVFYAQLKTPPVSSTGDVSVCFIPHTTSGSNSIYIGNPMCGEFSDPKAVKKITFVKYSQYTNALINSVMVFKDTSYFYPLYGKSVMTLAAYKDCMARLALGQTSYCASFKSVGQYILKSF